MQLVIWSVRLARQAVLASRLLDPIDKTWARLGQDLGNTWAILGQYLGNTWAILGQNLDKTWIHAQKTGKD
jgi:hypothetical protein